MGAFKDLLAAEVASGVPWASACPVLWSAQVHYAFVVLGCLVMARYSYATIFPPQGIIDVVRGLDFPDWMGNVIGGFHIMFVGCVTMQVWLARQLVSDQALSHVLDNTKTILAMQQTGPNHAEPFLILFLITAGDAMLMLLFPGSMLSLIKFMSPLPVILFLTPATNYVLDGIKRLSTSRVEEIRCELMEQCYHEASSVKNDLEASLALRDSDKQLSVAFWQQLTRLHQQMDKHMEDVWTLKNFGCLVLLDIALKASVTVLLSVGAVAARGRFATAWCVAGAALTVISILKSLHPLAEITALCQSTRVSDKSIMSLTMSFVNDERMYPEAKAEHARFLQYICVCPTGIEIPVVGLVTEQLIMTCAKIVATSAPLAITFVLKMLGREADATSL